MLERPVRKRKTRNPCPTCAMHLSRCICAHIPRLDLRTRVSLLIHAKELKRTTNTGRLAMHALVNSKMYVRGALAGPPDLSGLLSEQYENVILFPSDDAFELENLKVSKPIHLIVSDGNWRQASKINTRYPELKNLRRVKISHPNLAQIHLRKEHFCEGLSTLEAIAWALSAVEGRLAAEALMNLYQAKLRRTLEGRPPGRPGRLSTVSF
ncbi:MAG: tRNA-uridine aminocarboxypropyltransferase [Bdellovibrionales bacterium]